MKFTVLLIKMIKKSLLDKTGCGFRSINYNSKLKALVKN